MRELQLLDLSVGILHADRAFEIVDEPVVRVHSVYCDLQDALIDLGLHGQGRVGSLDTSGVSNELPPKLRVSWPAQPVVRPLVLDVAGPDPDLTQAQSPSRQQGLYEEFHWAMMDMSGRAEERSVLTIAAEIGLDIDQLRADMEAPEVAEHIETSMRLADLLGITGTPTFILGENLVPGAVEQEVLQR